MIHKYFHETIRGRRLDAGMTQIKVERQADLRAGLVSYIETGRMRRLPYPAEFAMPESVRDRPSVDFEDVFIFSKSKRYFWDQENGRQPHKRLWKSNNGGPMARGIPTEEARLGPGAAHAHVGDYPLPHPGGANMRASWKITTEPTDAEHWAAWPRELVRRLIKVGTSDKGCCPECGSQWARLTEKVRTLDGEPVASGTWSDDRDHHIGAQGVGHWRFGTKTTDKGWSPSCTCRDPEPCAVCAGTGDPCGRGGTCTACGGVNAYPPVPCSVLDQFSGIGRTGEVCYELGRNYRPVELSPKYAKMQSDRLGGHVAVARDTMPKLRAKTITGPLFA